MGWRWKSRWNRVVEWSVTGASASVTDYLIGLKQFFRFAIVKPRIYIDTSVIGGYYDEEFEDATRPLFDRITNQDFTVYLSEIGARLGSGRERIDFCKQLPLPDVG